MKQRLIGAAVLVALAVIFLPMLIKGPAPESGASDVPLELPPPPAGEFETRELPLVAPAGAPEGGALGMPTAPAGLPAVDTAVAGPADGDDAAAAPAAPAAEDPASAMTPPPVQGGDYAVSFGSYATRADAARVVDALRASQLPGYQQAVDEDGRTLFRVRIGPYASRAMAETARLRAHHVRDDVGSRVLNIAAGTPGAPADEAPEPDRTAAADEPPAAPAAEPAEAPAAPARPAAAADVGFAVQIGAFGVEANATRLRDRARELGFSAFVVTEPTAQGALSAVKVGPVADRAAAETLKAQVAARMGITGTIGAHP